MFKSIRRRGRSAATLGVAGALVGGGMAVAGEDGERVPGNNVQATVQESALAIVEGRIDAVDSELPLPPGAMGMGEARAIRDDLTYAEFHVLRDGEERVFRSDSGEVVSADESSIKIRHNDGSEITIPVDEDTQVLSGPGEEVAVIDLAEGKQVVVDGPKGGAADLILLPPKLGDVIAAPARALRGSGEPGAVHGEAFMIPFPPPGQDR